MMLQEKFTLEWTFEGSLETEQDRFRRKLKPLVTYRQAEEEVFTVLKRKRGVQGNQRRLRIASHIPLLPSVLSLSMPLLRLPKMLTRQENIEMWMLLEQAMCVLEDLRAGSTSPNEESVSDTISTIQAFRKRIRPKIVAG
jgi:hypothetical protein